MDNHADDTFACDLETRIEDFFDSTPQPNITAPVPVEEPSADETENPILQDLKSSVLALDWEITDDVLNDFIQGVEALRTPFKGSKVNLTFLKMLTSLGGYLLKHKSKAHPETINRILAVYAAIEECVNNDSLSEKDRERMMIDEVKQFKQFKLQITKSVPSTSSMPSEVKQPTNDTSNSTETIIKAIDELRSFMASELSVIRSEIEKISNR